MKLRIRVANPSGNITVLVKTACAPKERAEIAGKLLAQIPGAEQVGFLTLPRGDGDLGLAMMGGEFCGNALRSAGLCYAVEEDLAGDTTVKVEVAGSATPFGVRVNVDRGEAAAAMPLPLKLETIEFGAKEAAVVCFEGIVHAVTAESRDGFSDEVIEAWLKALCARYGTAAAGLMFFSAETCSLVPAVYVVATDTLFFENSCASGSAAVAASLAARGKNGVCTLSLKEPGGMLEAVAEQRDGTLVALTVGGGLTLSPETEVEI